MKEFKEFKEILWNLECNLIDLKAENKLTKENLVNEFRKIEDEN